jgi:hypothetical protein
MKTQGNCIEIFQYSFHVFSCACPTVISSISGKSFHFPFPYFIQYNTYTYTLIQDIFSYLQLHIILQCCLPKWCRNWKWVTAPHLSVVLLGPNAYVAIRVGIRNTHIHSILIYLILFTLPGLPFIKLTENMVKWRRKEQHLPADCHGA